MSDPNNSFVTPVGRIVGGSLSIANTKNHAGEVCDPYWVVMLALPKSDPETGKLIARVKAAGEVGFADTPNQLLRPDFAWKIDDGDSSGVNQNGKVYNEREGYPDHFVFSFRTTFAFDTVGEDASSPINPATVEKGSYIRIGGSFKPNGRQDKPGMYMNLECAQFIRVGEKIGGGGMSAREAFGTAAPVAPPTPTPAHDIVNNVVAPPPAPPVAPAPPAGPVLTPAAVAAGVDVAAYMLAGWTELQLRTAGHIA